MGRFLLRPQAQGPGVTGRVWDEFEGAEQDHGLDFRYRLVRVWECPVEMAAEASTYHGAGPEAFMNSLGTPVRPPAAAFVALGLLWVLTACPARASAAPTTAPAAMKPYTEKIPGTDVTFDMVPIAGGTFRMGSPAGENGRKKDEGPQVEVQVEPFYMGKHEVTWPEYGEFLAGYTRMAQLNWRIRREQQIPANKLADAVTYPTPFYELAVGPILDRMGRGRGTPAVAMSQFAARQYTKWLSKKTGRFHRLPTEAEWEYACRAGTTTAYHFGDDPDKLGDYAWYYDNAELPDGELGYHKVGLKKPNRWGLYDMHGNVAEWVIDQHDPGWYRRFDGKAVRWSEAVNWPTKRYPCVMRGGHWESDPAECRSASRLGSSERMNRFDADFPRSPHHECDAYWVGFRVVSPVNEPPEAEKLRYWEAGDEETKQTLTRDREVRELITPPP